MSDIVDRLKQIADAKTGDPMPECLRSPSTFEPIAEGENVSVGFSANNWGEALSGVCAEAIHEITRLRATIEQLRNRVMDLEGDQHD